MQELARYSGGSTESQLNPETMETFAPANCARLYALLDLGNASNKYSSGCLY